MIKRTSQKGKEYVYDFSQIYVKTETKQHLQKLSHKHKLRYTDLINKMIEVYEGNI